MADTPPLPLGLDEHLCYSIYSASLAIGRAYKPLLDALGITYPQYLVLNVLWEQHPKSVGVGAIAERLMLESSTITPLLKRLESAGLLERTRNPADERQVLVQLTAQGIALKGRIGCIPERLLTTSGLTMDSLGALNAEVRALRDSIVEALPMV
jgi:MarR family transcriptional regulator, organic hydroperoxide resistance regulator